MAKKTDKSNVQGDSRYHDTWKLLKSTGMWCGAWSYLSSRSKANSRLSTEAVLTISWIPSTWPVRTWAVRRLRTTPAVLSEATRCSHWWAIRWIYSAPGIKMVKCSIGSCITLTCPPSGSRMWMKLWNSFVHICGISVSLPITESANKLLMHLVLYSGALHPRIVWRF